MKSAAGINAERIEAIIRNRGVYRGPRVTAQKIVEAFPELRPDQQRMDEHGRTMTIPEKLPWAT